MSLTLILHDHATNIYLSLKTELEILYVAYFIQNLYLNAHNTYGNLQTCAVKCVNEMPFKTHVTSLETKVTTTAFLLF